MAIALFLKKRASAEVMGFIDHLEDLRWHIIRSVIAVIVFAAVIFLNIDWIFDNVIAGPVNPDFFTYSALCSFSNWIGLGNTLCMPPINVNMQTTTFGGQFYSSISIAITGGFVAAFPYIFWELWQFIKPALSEKELKNTGNIIFLVSACFFLGAAFGYFVLGPFTFSFLNNYTLGTAKLLETKPALSDYLENLLNLIIGCALAFQLPVVSLLLTKFGIITPAFLKRSRKYAIVLMLVVAAIITPSPDWMSQLIVFVPLFLLYQAGIILSVRSYKRNLAAADA